MKRKKLVKALLSVSAYSCLIGMWYYFSQYYYKLIKLNQMAKITDKQLETLQDHNTKLSEIITQIGVLESNKHALLHEIAGVNKDLEEFKKDLEGEYGAINIDMSTGEYTIIEKEDEDDGELAVVKAED